MSSVQHNLTDIQNKSNKTKYNYGKLINYDNQKSFTQIPNSFLQEKLNLRMETRFMLCYLISKSEDWCVMVPHLVQHFEINKDKIYSMINELIREGYMLRVRNRDKGKFGSYDLYYSMYPRFLDDNSVNKIQEDSVVNKNSNTNQYVMEEKTEEPDLDSPFPEKADLFVTDLLITDALLNKENTKQRDQQNNIVDLKVDPVISYPSEVIVEEKKFNRRQKKHDIDDMSYISNSETVHEIFEFWKNVFNHPKCKLDNHRKYWILKGLELKSVSELKEAILGCAKTPHNIGQNERGEVYDGFHVIFKHSANIERFIRNNQCPPKPYIKKGAERNSEAKNYFRSSMVTILNDIAALPNEKPILQLSNGVSEC